MIDVKSRWDSVTDRQKWATRGASLVAKTKATKAVWFPPKPVETGAKAVSGAKSATKKTAGKTAGATKKATGGRARKANGAARKANGTTKKTAAKAASKAAGKTARKASSGSRS